MQHRIPQKISSSSTKGDASGHHTANPSNMALPYGEAALSSSPYGDDKTDPQAKKGSSKSRLYHYAFISVLSLTLFSAGVICGFVMAPANHGVVTAVAAQNSREEHKELDFVLDEQPLTLEENNDDTEQPSTAVSVATSVSTDESSASSLFDFAIVGFPKTATTFLHIYFNKWVKEIYLTKREMCAFYNETNAHDLAVRSFHPYETCPNPKYEKECDFDKKKTSYENMEMLYQQQIKWVDQAQVHGFKCPRLLEEPWILPNAMKFMKNTRFIVQIRHPIEWMQSYYNYKAKTIYPEKLLPLNELPAVCDPNFAPYINPDHGLKNLRNVCTDRANFHYAISRLAKTPMNTEKELDLLGHHTMSLAPTNEKVFLIESSQLNERDAGRSKLFRKELGLFLGLKEDALPKFQEHASDSVHQEKTSKVEYIDICDDQYKEVRERLLANGKQASKWLRTYFMKSPEVVVSSPEYVAERLKMWEKDPCHDPDHEWKRQDRDIRRLSKP